MDLVIGTAGWSIPAKDRERFPAEGSALERYSARFAGVEINSSFHRSHRAPIWQRWAESVPPGFRFAVKAPKTITHQRKLADCEELLERFLEESSPLGGKLAVILVQLPPKLAFDAALASGFFTLLGKSASAQIACEPRHPSWFEPEADALLERLRVARVAADPSIVPAAASPGGWRGLAYWRLHGSPAMYRSAYGEERLEAYARAIRKAGAPETWCMFDNTAASQATGNALALMETLRPPLRSG
jgi:uncharacterized protein YecE (DUF72 family)